MKTVFTCSHCGAVTGKSNDAPALLVNHFKNHESPFECIVHLSKKIKEMDGTIGDLIDHTGFNETDDPRQMGWVDGKGRP